MEVEIYTDGACRGNPGLGGYGVILSAAGRRKELSGGYRHTTNNRMELMGVIVGLAALKRTCEVRLYTDSRYVVEAMRKGWAVRWKAWGYKKKKNGDLWDQVLDLCSNHTVEFIWVKGHANNAHNNRCDELAVAASQQPNLPADAGFEEHLARAAIQLSLIRE